MKLGFGLITCQRYPGDPRDARQLYPEAIEMLKAVEGAGLDSAWTSEHHFWDDEYMPSLLVASAAFAAATERLEIGTGVLLGPLYDPIRLAEDVATVDALSGGRFILGLGIGWRQEEFDRLGVPMEKPGRRLSETVKILKKAWADGAFTHDGQIYSYEPTNVTPKPGRDIPVWLGGFADPPIRRAGRIADGYLGSSSRREGDPLEAVAHKVAMAKEGLADAGRDPSGFTFAFHEPVWVAEDPEADFEKVVPHVHYMRWKYSDMGPAFGREGELPRAPEVTDEVRAQVLDSLIIGTVEDVAKRLGAFKDVAGDDVHLIARSYFPGMSLEDTLGCIERLGQVRELL